jgi:transcription initiation factor IIE alpha subunit
MKVKKLKETLLWLFTGSRGGENRAKIVRLIFKKPLNAYRISEELNLNYNTINHHLRLLKEHKIIYCNKNVKYGALYFVTDNMKSQSEIFDNIVENLKLEE